MIMVKKRRIKTTCTVVVNTFKVYLVNTIVSVLTVLNTTVHIIMMVKKKTMILMMTETPLMMNVMILTRITISSTKHTKTGLML